MRGRIAELVVTEEAVFQLFGRPKHGITPQMFRHQMYRTFGFELDEAKARELFDTYDVERRCCIAFIRTRSLQAGVQGEA